MRFGTLAALPRSLRGCPQVLFRHRGLQWRSGGPMSQAAVKALAASGGLHLCRVGWRGGASRRRAAAEELAQSQLDGMAGGGRCSLGWAAARGRL
jgi:hypothetical protein